jgi:hypothetical protein
MPNPRLGINPKANSKNLLKQVKEPTIKRFEPVETVLGYEPWD